MGANGNSKVSHTQTLITRQAQQSAAAASISGTLAPFLASPSPLFVWHFCMLPAAPTRALHQHLSHPSLVLLLAPRCTRSRSSRPRSTRATMMNGAQTCPRVLSIQSHVVSASTHSERGQVCHACLAEARPIYTQPVRSSAIQLVVMSLVYDDWLPPVHTSGPWVCGQQVRGLPAAASRF